MTVYFLAGFPNLWAQGATPNPEKKAAAKAKLVDGDRLLKQGEFQQALVAFKEAFDLYASPKIHYNFGLAYEGMGRNAEAIEAFETFLQDAPDASPDVKEKARSTREALLRRVGTLNVTADVDRATVIVDGREVGTTPLAHDLRLDPGPHLLQVERGAGIAPFTKRLDVVAGTAFSASVRFATSGAATAESLGPSALAPPPAQRAQLAPLAAAPDLRATRSRSQSWRIAGIATASAGALCLAGGLLFGLAARSAAEDVSTKYDPGRDSVGKRDATLQWAGYGVGAAALATGALLWAHGVREDATESTRVHAFITPGRLIVEGRF